MGIPRDLARRLWPSEVRRSLVLSVWAAQEALDLVNPAFWSNHRRIEHFRDRHRGERCFILGNGPSLIRLDLSKLRGERTFGLNRIYLLFPVDVDSGSFPLLFEIADGGGEIVHSDDSIRSEDLSQQGLFLFQVVPRRQVPDGRYVARIGPAGGGSVTEYPFQVIAASAE